MLLSAADLKCSFPTITGNWHEGSTLSCKSDMPILREDLSRKHLSQFIPFPIVRLGVSHRPPIWIAENYFYVFQNPDRHVDSEHASNMSNSISPSASKNDWDYLLGSVPKEWFAQNQLVQTRILFLRVQKFMVIGTGNYLGQPIMSPPSTFVLITTILYKIGHTQN